MTDFTNLLQGGNAWLFVPSAILLGALHGLEPGHSKTMMAAFIIAIRGTVMQAVLLGLAATISHTAVVWIVALAGLHFGAQWSSEASEPYFQLVSAVLILAVAFWMLWRTWSEQRAHSHGHDHHHGNHAHTHDHDLEPMDAHQRAHAADIGRRFSRGTTSTWQIILFGLTGGLIPCPAAITVLLLCLQLKKFALGATLVLCFSIGLAIPMVAAGVAAALSVKHVASRWPGFDRWAARAPYISGLLIIAVGLYTGYLGLSQLNARALG